MVSLNGFSVSQCNAFRPLVCLADSITQTEVVWESQIIFVPISGCLMSQIVHELIFGYEGLEDKSKFFYYGNYTNI